MILVDGNGRPFERPEPPPPDAPPAAFAAWIRAMNVYNDAVAACAGKAFAKAFTKALRRR